MLIPRSGYVVVKMQDSPETTSSGLIVPKDDANKVVVVEAISDSEQLPVGTKLVMLAGAGIEVVDGEETFYLVKDEYLIAKIS